MPRINPVSDLDKAIGRRLRDLRDSNLAKRTALALKIGISSDQLASYEFGRVPLPWPVGDRICETFNVSQVWLATGQGDRGHYYPIRMSDLESSSLARARFSVIYENHFAPKLRVAQADAKAKIFGPDGFLARTRRLGRMLKDPRLRWTPDEAAKAQEVLDRMAEIVEKVVRKITRKPKI